MKLIKDVARMAKIKMFVDKHNLKGLTANFTETTLRTTPKCLSIILWRSYIKVAQDKWHQTILIIAKEAYQW